MANLIKYQNENSKVEASLEKLLNKNEVMLCTISQL